MNVYPSFGNFSPQYANESHDDSIDSELLSHLNFIIRYLKDIR